MKLLNFILLVWILVTPIISVEAKYDPLIRENNKFGIHIADPHDIADAATLVNSNGGNWGYITLVIPETDRNTEKWQERFNVLRRNSIIPIVRIAGSPRDSIWTIPSDDSLRDWVTFLDSLNWPIENRYVILFNEPNHAKEWGGKIDPEGYADVLVNLGKKLKERNSDFFILPAGLDMSAQTDGASMDGAEYLKRMILSNSEVLTLIDGWTSHSYPNPAFSASPAARGKGTIASFQWELDFLYQLGLQRSLPIFITETGWVHTEGKTTISQYKSADEIANHIRFLSDGLWQDNRVVAITPFVYSYQDYPFDHFSFVKIGSRELYPHAEVYKNIPKPRGKPQIRHSFEILSQIIPDKLVQDSSYTLITKIRNTGQAIIGSSKGYELGLTSLQGSIQYVAGSVPDIEPQSDGELTYFIRTPHEIGSQNISLFLIHQNDVYKLASASTSIVPPPSIVIEAQLGWKKESTDSDVSVLVYQDKTLLHSFYGLRLENGKVTIKGLTSVVPGSEHRIVLLVPYYLPRQEITILNHEQTTVRMKRLLPFDFNKNGSLGIDDIPAIFRISPRTAWSLFVGQ